ncbi:MAG: hypothetical protein ACR2PG_22215 [Hyphomicrobiaceae bacterium]
MTALRKCNNYIAILLIIGSGALVARHASADVRQPPGSRVAMDVPEAFEISQLFTGFIKPSAGLSIVITELPRARYQQIVSSLEDGSLAKKGMTDITRGQLSRPDEHIFFTARQHIQGRDYQKFVLLIQASQRLAVISATAPVRSFEIGTITGDAITKALLTAKLRRSPAPIDKPYSLGSLGPFKEAGKLSTTAILYTTDGQLRAPNPNDDRSIVIIAPSIDRTTIDDLPVFATELVERLRGFEDVRILNRLTKYEIDGRDAVEITATATSKKTSDPIHIRQVVVQRDKGGYYRMLALVRRDDWARMAPAIKKMFESLSISD